MTEVSAAGREIAQRVIGEVREALIALAGDGTSHVIDLRRLPHMSPEAYSFLKEALGTGEVSARVDAVPRVEIAETGFPGVWWITYRRASEDIATEMIEVSFVPKILITAKAQVMAGVKRLTARSLVQTESVRN
jgi:hydrogenase-1 operon protein HyaF